MVLMQVVVGIVRSVACGLTLKLFFVQRVAFCTVWFFRVVAKL